MEDGSYWKKHPSRYSRRQLLRGAAVAGGAIAGMVALGCSSTRSPKGAAGASGGPSPSGSPTEQPKAGGIFHTYGAANPNLFDPFRGASAAAGVVTGNIFSYLFDFKTGPDPKDYTRETDNGVAVSFETPDSATWTFKLRPDVTFHNIPPVNGHPLEAEDIKASWVRAFSFPENIYLPYQDMIDPTQIQTPAKDTVVFRLKYPYAPLRANLAGSSAEILPREALAGGYDPAKQAIGSGPFLLDHYTPDVEMSLKRNPRWYAAPRPYVNGLLAPIIPDASQQLAQFTAGHLDVLRPAPNDVDVLRRDNPKATVIETPNTGQWIVVGHMDHPASPYTDPRIRQGLSMAIDRASLGKAVYNNLFAQEGTAPSGFGKWALPPDQFGTASQYYQYNPAEAKKLLQASGAAGQLRRFMYPIKAYGQAFDSAAETVNSQLNAAGLKLELVALDYNKDYLGGGKGVLYGAFPDDTLVLESVMLVVSLETTMLANFQSTSIRNKTQVHDPQLDSLLQKMATTLDDGARLQAADDVQRYIAEKVYIIPIPSPLLPTAIQSWVQDYEYSGGEGAVTSSRFWINK